LPKLIKSLHTFGFLELLLELIVVFGIALNFGLSGFVNILKGIQYGVERIPSTFDVMGKKVADLCRWEGDIFSQMVFVQRNCTETIADFF